mmetsp:Transcript_133152/g.344578  ORF Transcript_133152/g.344578 Transcript_133152/m.344578 type:complete len:282 (-) Transcript_133152:445-1290(-)
MTFRAMLRRSSVSAIALSMTSSASKSSSTSRGAAAMATRSISSSTWLILSSQPCKTSSRCASNLACISLFCASNSICRRSASWRLCFSDIALLKSDCAFWTCVCKVRMRPMSSFAACATSGGASASWKPSVANSCCASVSCCKWPSNNSFALATLDSPKPRSLSAASWATSTACGTSCSKKSTSDLMRSNLDSDVRGCSSGCSSTSSSKPALPSPVLSCSPYSSRSGCSASFVLPCAPKPKAAAPLPPLSLTSVSTMNSRRTLPSHQVQPLRDGMAPQTLL